jgi:hypothetical protein
VGRLAGVRKVAAEAGGVVLSLFLFLLSYFVQGLSGSICDMDESRATNTPSFGLDARSFASNGSTNGIPNHVVSLENSWKRWKVAAHRAQSLSLTASM